MSSKRGRKRNDSLPPNRARDVQRAFRARRAAHLQELEQRVLDLEEENGYLRQVLNFPPSNRPPLGRGPTGKDKPTTPAIGCSSSQPPSSTSASRESSIVKSPAPRTTDVSVSSRPVQATEGGPSWNNGILVNDGHPVDVLDPRTPPFQLTPTMAPLLLEPSDSSYQRDPPSPSPRNSASTDVYISKNAVCSQPPDRHLSRSDSGQTFTLQNIDICEESSRRYSYISSPFSTYNHSHAHRQSSSPGPPIMQRQDHHHRNSSVSYPLHPHRRHFTGPQDVSLRQGSPSLPYPSPSQIQTHRPSNAHQSFRQGGVGGQDEVGHTAPPPPSRYHPYDPNSPLDHDV